MAHRITAGPSSCPAMARSTPTASPDLLAAGVFTMVLTNEKAVAMRASRSRAGRAAIRPRVNSTTWRSRARRIESSCSARRVGTRGAAGVMRRDASGSEPPGSLRSLAAQVGGDPCDRALRLGEQLGAGRLRPCAAPQVAGRRQAGHGPPQIAVEAQTALVQRGATRVLHGHETGGADERPRATLLHEESRD